VNLSIVLAGRNDLYGGGDFMARMNRCLSSVLPLDCEVILVEWNPPADRPTLERMIRFPGIHLITVASEIHGRQHGSELMPMYEYRAKNVGIRRATREWVLVMNSDIELTPAMRGRLQGEFDPECIYGAKRHDIHLGTIVQVVDGPGDFVLMTRANWHKLRGYLDLVSYTHIDSLLWWTADHYGIKKKLLNEYVIHEDHERSEQQTRWGIHSSDMHHFVGQKNEEDWGLAGVTLSEAMT
jgi:hypothetical protein